MSILCIYTGDNFNIVNSIWINSDTSSNKFKNTALKCVFMDLAYLFSKTSQKAPDKVAIEFEGSQITFKELDLAGNKAANSLKSEGVLKGDRLALFVPNCMELVYSIIGAFKGGNIVVPVNIHFKEEEVLHILKDSKAKAIITDMERLPIINRIRKYLPNLRQVILSDGKDKNAMNLNEMISHASSETPKVKINDRDYAIMFYTSGTTGKPKGAPLTNKNVAAGVKALVKSWKWTRNDVFLLALPLYHIHGIGVALCGSLYAGNTVILKKKFDAQNVLETIQSRKITLFMGVPTMYFKLLEVPGCKKYDVSSMRLFVSGSAPLSRELFYRFKKTFGQEILERAGMSETMMNFSNPYDGRRVPGSVGFCLPGVKIKITDKAYKSVPISTEGEILIKGPNVFHGYWNRPELNRHIFVNGWFVTGDVGKIGKNGYIYILGRSKDLIISGGINIYPKEIEDVIESMPQVKECAVVGVPDKVFGESVKAYAVLNDGNKLTGVEVIAYCKEKLASFKKPKYVEFLEALPKNTMGKIQKNILREMHQSK